MSKNRVIHVFFGLFVAATVSLTSTQIVSASDYSPQISVGAAASNGWFNFFRSQNNKSYNSSSTKKAPPSMSNGSFYEKWRADRKVSGRAHRP